MPETFDEQLQRLRRLALESHTFVHHEGTCALCADCETALAELLRRWDALQVTECPHCHEVFAEPVQHTCIL
jgi:hypothetical protein